MDQFELESRSRDPARAGLRTCQMKRRPLTHAALAAAFAAFTGGASAAEWDFTVLLDGKPIGSHRFVVEGSDERKVESDALYEVKLLGLTVYRYRHHASERWRGECLAALKAHTDDNGAVTDVTKAFDAQACTWSFAYWNPAIAKQQRLLDPGTGVLRDVRVAALEPATITVQGRAVEARRVRISGLAHPIDVWYEGDRWVGLDTTVGGERRLSYRLP